MKTPLMIAFLLLVGTTAFSQTLEQKWGKMLEKAENYEPYKVIKKTELADFWKSTKDTIQRYQKELKAERAVIGSQKSEISQLKSQAAQLNTQLSQNETDKNSVSFLGIKANKFVYLSVLCFLLLTAIVGIGILYYRYHNSNAVTIQKANAYQLISKEFDEYKLGKIEMERKLRRELQTQVNKLEELKKGNG